MAPRPVDYLRNKFVTVPLSAAALLVALFFGRSFWTAKQAYSEASARARLSGGVPFSIRSLTRHSRGPFGTPLAATDNRSAAGFEGDIYVAANSSLGRYDRDGSLKQTWYVGADLPPYPLQRLTVRRGIGVPELWIGTDGGGALIFDGKQFRQLLPAALAERKINSLLALSDGRVVLGTDGAGVLITDGKRLERLHSTFSATKVSALAGDQDTLWIGTLDSGVWLWRAGAALHFVNELPDPQVLAIAADERNAWIATPFGIAAFGDRSFKRRLAEGVFARTIAKSGETLLVGTMDEGMLRIPLAGRARSFLHAGLPASEASVVEFANLGGETTAITPHSILRAESGDVLFSTRRELTASHISALAADHRGRLWIGYFDRGLDILDPQSGKPPEHIEDDVLFCINRIKEDPSSHNIAIGTANGLALFDASDRIRQVLDHKHGLIADHVTDLLFDRGDELRPSALAVATPAGITFLNEGSAASISAFQGLVNNHVYTLAGDASHMLAGTLGGFSLLNERGVRTSYSIANSNLHQNWITASVADGSTFYLGTYGAGVVRVEADNGLTTFRDFDYDRVEINPNALECRNRIVYAGTAGQGLAVLRIGDTRWRFVREGLPSLNVTALAFRGGRVYIGTDNGLISMPEPGSNL